MKGCKSCEKETWWLEDTPMYERLRIISEKAIYCPYCGKLLSNHKDEAKTE